MDELVQEFWSIPAERMLEVLDTTPDGLESKEAADRLKRYGSNLLKPRKRAGSVALFFRQFKSLIIIILIGAAIVSIFLSDTTTATIILVIVFVSGALGFWQERGAQNAMRHLLAIVEVKTAVLRDGDRRDVPVEDVVPGDVVLLDAGDIIPADSLLLESPALHREPPGPDDEHDHALERPVE